MHVAHFRRIYWTYFTLKSVLKLLRVTELPASFVLWIRLKYYCFQVIDNAKTISNWSAQFLPRLLCAPSPTTLTLAGKQRRAGVRDGHPSSPSLLLLCWDSTRALQTARRALWNQHFPQNYNSRTQKGQIKVMRCKSRLLKYIRFGVWLLVSIRGFY